MEPRRVVEKQADIIIEHTYRVRCPQCGEDPEGPFISMVAARSAQRLHWQAHRDERV